MQLGLPFKQIYLKEDWEGSSVVDYLLSTHKALGLILSTGWGKKLYVLYTHTQDKKD